MIVFSRRDEAREAKRELENALDFNASSSGWRYSETLSHTLDVWILLAESTSS